MSLKCCCSRPVCSARVFSFLCVCSRLLWVSAGLPTDVRGRPTGGAPHSQTPTLPGMVFSGPPTDARGRPTGGGGGCGSSRHAPAFGQQLLFGLLRAQCRFGVVAFFGLPCQQIRRDPGLQVFLPLLQRHQLLVRGAVVVDWVAAFAPAPQ